MAARGGAGGCAAGISPGWPKVRSSTPAAPFTGSTFRTYQPASSSYCAGVLPSLRGACTAEHRLDDRAHGRTFAADRHRAGGGHLEHDAARPAQVELAPPRLARPDPRRTGGDDRGLALEKRASTALARAVRRRPRPPHRRRSDTAPPYRRAPTSRNAGPAACSSGPRSRRLRRCPCPRRRSSSDATGSRLVLEIQALKAGRRAVPAASRRRARVAPAARSWRTRVVRTARRRTGRSPLPPGRRRRCDLWPCGCGTAPPWSPLVQGSFSPP